MYMRIWLISLPLITIFGGCQVASEMLHKSISPQMHNYDKSTDALKVCNINKAISIVSQNQNKLLQNSELGLAHYFKYNYEQSNKAFNRAINEYRINENKASISLSNIIRNEYQGEGFDKVFLHNYKAINYLMLGDAQSARVEAKNSNIIQEEEKLKLYEFTGKYNEKNKNSHLISRYQRLFNSVNAKHHPYQNPFAYYISALAYAEDSDYDNALVDIRKAIKFSTRNSLLESKLLTYENRESKPSVELFFDVGQSPLKSQVRLKMDMGNGEQRMAYLPSYRLAVSDIDHIKIVNIEGKEIAKSSLLSDINAIKVNEFREKLPAMLSLISKEVALSIGTEALDKDSKLLGVIFKTASAIYAQNDISTWSLLPQKILVISFVPKSNESYEILVMDKDNKVITKTELLIRKNKNLKNIYKHFIIRENKICKQGGRG